MKNEEIMNSVTSNGMREWTDERVNQALNEARKASLKAAYELGMKEYFRITEMRDKFTSDFIRGYLSALVDVETYINEQSKKE